MLPEQPSAHCRVQTPGKGGGVPISAMLCKYLSASCAKLTRPSHFHSAHTETPICLGITLNRKRKRRDHRHRVCTAQSHGAKLASTLLLVLLRKGKWKAGWKHGHPIRHRREWKGHPRHCRVVAAGPRPVIFLVSSVFKALLRVSTSLARGLWSTFTSCISRNPTTHCCGQRRQITAQ